MKKPFCDLCGKEILPSTQFVPTARDNRVSYIAVQIYPRERTVAGDICTECGREVLRSVVREK